MNGFLKTVLHRISHYTQIIKILLKQLKRKQRKYILPRNYLNVLDILKNMEYYERYNWKTKNKIDIYLSINL